MSFFGALEQKLQGFPDIALTWILITLAAFLVVVACYAPITVKAAVAAWVMFP